MKGNDKILELLNDILTNELVAINQYFLHAKLCQQWGYQRLAKFIRSESIEEMRHAEWLVDRVLFLEGLPNLQRMGKVNVGQTVAEQLSLDVEIERNSVKTLNDGIELCRSLGDNGSRELLERILIDSEKHLDWIETQLELIKQVGEANYLSQQIKEG
jgi:bacterioferritin